MNSVKVLYSSFKSNSCIINIVLNFNCNNTCKYCFINDIKSDVKKSSLYVEARKLKLFFDNVKELKYFKNKDIEIILTGGEPTLNPDFFNILKLLDSYSFIKKVYILSNGTSNKDLYINSFNILKEKLYLLLTYHPSSSFNLEYYLDLYKKLSELPYYKFKKGFAVLYLLDDDIELATHKNNINYIFNVLTNKNFDIENFIMNEDLWLNYDIILKEPVNCNEEFIEFYNNITKNLKILYENEVYNFFNYKNTVKNLFKGLYCNSMKNCFYINRYNIDYKISCECDDSLNAYSIIKSDCKKFFDKINNNIFKCKNNYCGNGLYLIHQEKFRGV